MKKFLVYSIFQLLIFQFSHSQNNIGIGTITPNTKALLDLSANDKGFLVPRVSSAERVAINPASNADAALLVYDTDDNLFYYWNSTQWIPFPQPGSNNISLNFDVNTGTLSLTDAAGTLTTNVPPNNDSDPANELITNVVFGASNILTIEEGGNTWSTTINVNDADSDPTNEIQQLAINGNILNLSLSNNNIDLSPYLDNTDNQTLSLNGQTLTISNGNSVTLTDNVNDADANPTNELQTIVVTSAANNTDVTHTLTPAGNATTINDGDWQFNGTNLYNLNSGGVRVGIIGYPNQCGGTFLNESAAVKFAVMSGFSSFGNFNNDPIVNAAAPPTTWAGGVGSLTLGMNRLAGTSNVDFWNSSDPNNGSAALTLNDRGFNWRNFRNNGGACAEQLLMTLTGAGNLTIAGGSYQTSDKRLKSNIESIDAEVLGKVMQLVPSTYKKVNAALEQGNQIFSTEEENAVNDFGFIAQEVYKVFPELVYKPKDENKELWAIDYARLSVFLTKAIQEQQKTVETLQQANKHLKSQTELLKNFTTELSNRLQVIEKSYSVK